MVSPREGRRRDGSRREARGERREARGGRGKSWRTRRRPWAPHSSLWPDIPMSGSCLQPARLPEREQARGERREARGERREARGDEGKSWRTRAKTMGSAQQLVSGHSDVRLVPFSQHVCQSPSRPLRPLASRLPRPASLLSPLACLVRPLSSRLLPASSGLSPLSSRLPLCGRYGAKYPRIVRASSCGESTTTRTGRHSLLFDSAAT
jgi:hypothetical protein